MERTVDGGASHRPMNEALEVLRHALQAVHAPCLVVDENATVLQANRATHEKLGYFSTDIVGQPVRTICPHSRDSACMDPKRQAQGLNQVIQTKSGRPVPCTITSASLPNVGLVVMSFTLQADSPSWQLEQLEQQAHRLERQLAQAKSQAKHAEHQLIMLQAERGYKTLGEHP